MNLFSLIKNCLSVNSQCVQTTAANECQAEKIQIKIIGKWLDDSDWHVRVAAMNACQGRDVPFDFLEKGINDEDWRVQKAAVNAFQVGYSPLRDLPLDIILKWSVRTNKNYFARRVAMNACEGKDVPFSIIERGLGDYEFGVCAAAARVCKANGFEIPVIRDFEPPEFVYKKCLGGVIVVASIPPDAHVRFTGIHIGRASKAFIKNVIGTLHGEPVGISRFDQKTMYRSGDLVEIEDFDLSPTKFSTGFHFFTNRKRAEAYTD